MDLPTIELEIQRLYRAHRRLKITVALLVGSLVVVLLVAAKAATRDVTFGTIDAQRINIREPDGTIRLTISNRARFPGAFVHNKEVAHPRDMAGFLFFNDEGTEQGGLIYNGKLAANGKSSSGLSLTFDRYQQDQQMQLLGVDDDGTHFAGLSFNDVADGIARPVFSEKDEALGKAGHYAIKRRVFIGKSASQNSMLQLLDASGKPRLELQVTPAGDAKIVFLDADGKATREISGGQ